MSVSGEFMPVLWMRLTFSRKDMTWSSPARGRDSSLWAVRIWYMMTDISLLTVLYSQY